MSKDFFVNIRQMGEGQKNFRKFFIQNALELWRKDELQIVRNLIQNAYQYTVSGGKVKISTQPVKGEIRVVFTNTGVEVGEKGLPFIFERFYRGEQSRSREHGGAGIGLAIVKELVEAHDGQVGAEITNDETLVWFSLPSFPI